MMFGGNAVDMLKNSTLLALPDWYVKGLASHLSEKWNPVIDNRVRDAIQNKRFTRFNQLSGQESLLAGQSVWHYISETYGESVISNLLYMTRVSRNMESAFLFVLGVSMENLMQDYMNYYQNQYDDRDNTRSLPGQAPVVKKPKNTRVYTQAKVSPDGNYLVYVSNELGQYKVWLQDLRSPKKPKKIIKAGNKIDRVNDYSYPLLAWHPSGKLFSMITEEKGSICLSTYEPETRRKTKRTIINFDKVLDFSYSDDGKKFAMSAVQKGQSDIYVFTVASNAYEQITKDIYDDLNPRFVHGSKEIIFSSNRPNDTIRFETESNFKALQQPTKDLFVFNYSTKSNTLRRLTNTPTINETNPADYDSVNYAFISDQSGIRNRCIAHYDSVISYVDTSAHYRFIVSGQPASNFSRNLLEQDISLKANKVADILFNKGNYWIYVSDLKPAASLPPVELKNTAFRDEQLKLEKKNSATKTQQPQLNLKPVVAPGQSRPAPVKTERKDSNEVDISNYVFESDSRLNQKKTEPLVTDNPSKNPVKTPLDSAKQTKADSAKKVFKTGPQKNYYINFATEKVTTQLNSSPLFPSYQPFSASSPGYQNPTINGVFKMNLNDLFEDYGMTAGFMLQTDLTAEYLISFENRVKRLDKQLILHRVTTDLNSSDGYPLIYQTHEAKYTLKYPFTEVDCIRGTIGIRSDRTVMQGIDVPSLEQTNLFDTWASAKLEYIFDNTLNKGLNLYNGLRFKLFAEYYRDVDQSSSIIPSPLLPLTGESNAASTTGVGNDFYVIGLDVRYYQKIHRNLIWASRIAGSSSFGKEKLLYYLGGVDNWINPQFNSNTQIANSENYAFQTLATPLRGFIENVRNGNTFFVANNELRWPIFKYFLNRPIRSDFISNFQLIGFTDVGTAWSGPSPYSAQNNVTTNVVTQSNVTITLTSQNEPLVGGVGFGLRTRIFGYFIRFDRAWGIENRVLLSPVNYVSLSLDF